MPPTGNAVGGPAIAVFVFGGGARRSERVYLDTATMLTQIGRGGRLAVIAGGLAVSGPARVGAGTERGGAAADLAPLPVRIRHGDYRGAARGSFRWHRGRRQRRRAGACSGAAVRDRPSGA